MGNGLVGQSPGQTAHDLHLARRQYVQTNHCGIAMDLDCLVVVEPRRRQFDDAEQVLARQRLAEEIDGAIFHRGHRQRYLAMAGDDDDREQETSAAQLLLHREPVHLIHADIKQHASRIKVRCRGQKGLSVLEGQRAMPGL